MPLVVADTDFLSSFLKIERLHLVRSFFQAESIVIPSAVYREIAVTDLLQALLGIDWIDVQDVDRDCLETVRKENEISTLGRGEQEAIAIAHQAAGSVLLMSDRKAARCAEQMNVEVVDIPTFLLAYKELEECSEGDFYQIVEDLKSKDRYGFSKKTLALLFDKEDHLGFADSPQAST